MKKTGIVQGDAYVLPIVITTGDTIITDSLVTAVRIKVGKYSGSWPGGKISYSAGKWLFPLTQEQTQNLTPGKDEYQVQIQFAGGETVGTKPAAIGVVRSVLRGTFGEELAAAERNVVELKQLNAYISDVDINVGGGGGSPYSVLFVPQELSESEKAQARKNIGAGTDYTLPKATQTTLGGIMLGDGLTMDPEGRVNVDSDIGTSGVFNASTHYDFPSIGDPNVIYKASSEKAIYQWNPTTLKYEPISDNSTDLSSASILDGGDASGHEGETVEINFIDGGDAYGTD